MCVRVCVCMRMYVQAYIMSCCRHTTTITFPFTHPSMTFPVFHQIRIKRSTLQKFPTYGELYQGLCSATGEIPIAVYRTQRNSVALKQDGGVGDQVASQSKPRKGKVRERERGGRREVEREGESEEGREGGRERIVVCWLFDVPATGWCISGTDLLRQVYMLPL